MVITGDLNYSDPLVQYEIEKLTRSLENTSYVTSALYTESWIRSFLSYVERNKDDMNISLSTEQEFIDSVRTQWLFPGNPFSLDVKFNENNTRIVASRFLIQAANITDTNHEKVMVHDLREICRMSPLNATIFHPYFVFFDQFELIRPTSLQAMIIGAVIMMITSFIFIPNILCSLWVAFSVISIELGVTGYMAVWDVNLDSISMINLIMCIGFSVDFTAHICYTYMSSKERCPKARVRESLHSLGLPIIQGSTSTILGIIALLLAQSYIFLVFFKMVFLVIFFGAMHGLFLLPVLLSLFGPSSWKICRDEEEDSENSIDEGHFKAIDKNKRSDLFHISQSYYLQQPTANKAKNGFNTKSPPQKDIFKVYGDEKDLGIGTSGEDSSESSSSRSQYLQAFASSSTSNDGNMQRYDDTPWVRPTAANYHQDQCDCSDYIVDDFRNQMSKIHDHQKKKITGRFQERENTTTIPIQHHHPHYMEEEDDGAYDNEGFRDHSNKRLEHIPGRSIPVYEPSDQSYSVQDSTNSLMNDYGPQGYNNCSLSLSTTGGTESSSDHSCHQRSEGEEQLARIPLAEHHFQTPRFRSEECNECWRSSTMYGHQVSSPPQPCTPKLSVMTTPCPSTTAFHAHYCRNLKNYEQRTITRRATSHQNLYCTSGSQRFLQTVYPVVQSRPLRLIN